MAHIIGGMAWACAALLLWWPAGSWRVIAFVGVMTVFWELRVWEPQPDGTYPFRWLVYDALTAMLASLPILGLRALL